MIEIQQLCKAFKTARGTRTVLKDFSLRISDGTFLGIQGKSGAGKSTLLSLIAGLQQSDSGNIFIDGTNITGLNDTELAQFRNRHIGFVSQEQSFLENLTVFDNVRLPAFISKTARHDVTQVNERTDSLLTKLGIDQLAQQYPQNLSGGENHRVLIARALINNPDIILADEPTDSVDEERTEEIIRIFRNLADQGKTIILVSHDTRALELCDSIVHL